MKTATRYAIWLVGIVNICLFLTLSFRWFVVKSPSNHQITYEDYINLSLLLLQLILAALAIGLAAMAFIGYNAIKDAAERHAEEAAEKFVKAYIAANATPDSSSPERGTASSPTADRPQTVAKEGDAL